MAGPLADRFSVTTHRLALGLEPIDGGHGTRAASGLLVELEGPGGGSVGGLSGGPHGRPPSPRGAQVERHPSNRFVIRHAPGLLMPIRFRLFDRQRRFVPRRLRVDVPPEAEVAVPETDPTALSVPVGRRTLRPILFPGAAYPVSEQSTGIRGQVVRDGTPMPWARITATLTATGEIVGRAHGDDRGDFLLLVAFAPGHVGDPDDPLVLDVEVAGPDAPSSDLPQEPAVISHPPPDLPPAVSVEAGTQLPATYRPSSSSPRQVPVPLGRIASAGLGPFPFT